MKIRKRIYGTNLPTRAVAVYLYLRDRANAEGQCFPSRQRVAADLNMSLSTVKRALEDLLKAGYIAKEMRLRKNGGRSSNLYTIL